MPRRGISAFIIKKNSHLPSLGYGTVLLPDHLEIASSGPEAANGMNIMASYLKQN